MKTHQFKFLFIALFVWIGTNAQVCNTNNNVTGLKATGNTNNSVTIAFNQLNGVKNYELRAFNKGSFNGNINGGAVSFKGGSSSPLKISGLKGATEYTFVIRALCNSGGPTPVSQINASTAGGNPNPDPDPDPNPSTVSINCNSLPSSLATGTSIKVPVQYSADQNRDVVVELWNSRWIAQGRKTVGAGSGTTTVTINLNSAPSAGSNYLLKASVRPVGAGWQQNIKACSKNNISITGGGNNGGNNGGGNNGGNVGNPDNGGDTGCTGKDTYDQGVKIVPNANSWKDSYKANGYCFCKSSFDHGVGNFKITINGKGRNIKDICDELKKHPKFRNLRNGDPKYNTIQCGNDPGHGDAITIQGKRIKDEKVCPGRVDQGSKGCKCKGPKFDMTWLSSRSRFGGSARAKSLDAIDSGSFSIYPNPITVGSEAFLSIYSEKDAIATISIHDLSGKLIASMNRTEIKDTTSAIEITSLINKASSANGTYIISYKVGSISKSKVIVVK